RRRVALYPGAIELDDDAVADVVRRRKGATASFSRELSRKATLEAAQSSRETVTAGDVTHALDELLHDAAALTRVLLGSAAQSDPAARWPHGWMEGMAEAG